MTPAAYATLADLARAMERHQIALRDWMVDERRARGVAEGLLRAEQARTAAYREAIAEALALCPAPGVAAILEDADRQAEAAAVLAGGEG